MLTHQVMFAHPQPAAVSLAAIMRAWVWLAVFSGAIVLSEPAPTDILCLGLIALVPLAGLLRYDRLLLWYLMLWLLVAAGALLAAGASNEIGRSATHAMVTLYLCVFSAVLAAFVAAKPDEHGTLVLKAYLAAALLAASAGLAGYFNALPGTFDLFTLFGRAAGTFKDPNVFGAFLVPAVLFVLHLVLTRPLSRSAGPLAAGLVLALALLLSFSRGAWLNLAVAAAAFIYLHLVKAASPLLRLRLAAILLLTGLIAALAVTATLQTDAVSSLFAVRAELVQGYDSGPEGRFGGQEKAARLLLDAPLGIGAFQFSAAHHHEDVHNVYLNIFLNAGWVGGLSYTAIVALSLGLGFAHALKATPERPIFLVAYAALLGVVIEGWIIDTDHWRHFYLLLALVWGLMTGDGRHQATHCITRSVRL
ncbi:MAG: O-antigen ligase family protein [Hyphomicrobiaceae bacterium]